MRRGWLAGCIAIVACGDGEVSGATTQGDTSGGSGSSTSMSADDDDTGTPPADDDGGPADEGSTSPPDPTGGEGESSSGGEPIGTPGCGQPAVDPTAQWIEHAIDVGGTMRQYWVWLPEPYDPARAYPVVYQFHGCSDSEDRQNNNPPVQDQSGADAIQVRGKAVGPCWDTAGQGPDVAFFDALVTDVEATWCADAERRFATGYSSGAFMTHVLACVRGDALLGVATIAGGQAGGDCTGPVAALLIHDTDDPTVGISASRAARDAHLERNGCDAVAAPTPVDPSPCAAYSGCDEGLPVVWCETSGQGHSRQDGLAAPAFWGFLSALSGG
jgi:polyhydroxybutyrate depolymerase